MMGCEKVIVENGHDYLKCQVKNASVSKINYQKEKRRLRLNSDGRNQAKGVSNPFYTSKYLLTTKEEQFNKTLSWLEENFTRCPGVCLPRCIMYAHYISFCQEHKYRPACAATFGKVIRQKFPELTTRRLGTRGNSKYHYYGVAIKESSIYYHTIYSGRGLTRFSGSKLLNEDVYSRKMMTSAKSGTLLPDFPSPSQLDLPYNVEVCKMETFMIMYRTHCQCILDTAVSRNFDGIQQYLLNFWQGIPKHLTALFDFEGIINLVCVCDSIMYMVLNDILVPVCLEDITDKSLTEVRNFVNGFDKLLQDGLKGGNQNLLSRKLEVSRRFVQAVKRQISFLHLAQSFREVLSDSEIASKLLTELDHIDMKSIGVQAIYTTFDCTDDQTELHEQYLRELRELLRENATVESYIEWLENIFKKQVLKLGEFDFVTFKLQAQQFLLCWSFFGTRVMHILTLNNSRTYGPFHLIRMMLDEYLLLITETKIYKQEQKQLQQLTGQLFKDNSKDLKISNVVTKSKFGAPSKPSTKLKNKQENKACRMENRLPPISSLSLPSSNLLPIDILPNDSFSRRYGEINDPAFHTLLTLTPPSSPASLSPISAIGVNSSTINIAPPNSLSNNSRVSEKNVTTSNISKNVSNLVDEHFRNCGIGEFSNPNKGDNESEFSDILQKFLDSQNQSINPYEVGDDVYMNNNSSEDDDDTGVSPLQCSFSQILNGDVLFAGVVNETNLEQGSADQSSAFSLSNFANNLAFMESFTEQNLDQNLFQTEDEEIP